MRVLRINKPEAWMIAIACIGSIVVGGAQPVTGYLYSSTMKVSWFFNLSIFINILVFTSKMQFIIFALKLLYNNYY